VFCSQLSVSASRGLDVVGTSLKSGDGDLRRPLLSVLCRNIQLTSVEFLMSSDQLRFGLRRSVMIYY